MSGWPFVQCRSCSPIKLAIHSLLDALLSPGSELSPVIVIARDARRIPLVRLKFVSANITDAVESHGDRLSKRKTSPSRLGSPL